MSRPPERPDPATTPIVSSAGRTVVYNVTTRGRSCSWSVDYGLMHMRAIRQVWAASEFNDHAAAARALTRAGALRRALMVARRRQRLGQLML